MSLLKLVETISSGLTAVIVKAGQIIYCSDTLECYIDTHSNTRIKITNVIYLDTEAARTAMFAPLSNQIYLVKASNRMYRYSSTDSKWYILNNFTSTLYIQTLKASSTNSTVKTVTINIADYNPTIESSSIVVYKNTVRLFETTDYTISTTGKTILLVASILKTDTIRFELPKIRTTIV